MSIKPIAVFGVLAGVSFPPVCGLAAGLPVAPKPVMILNPAAQPVPGIDVDNPARQPFQYTLSPSSSTSSQAQDSFVVPAGKRLVIEYYTAQLTQYPSGGYGYEYLIVTAGGNQSYYKVVPPVASTVPYNQLTRLYADPGSSVTALVGQSSGSSSGGLINVSGYLVNLP